MAKKKDNTPRKLTEEEVSEIRDYLLDEGFTSEEIAEEFGCTKMQIAGVKAHMTMGTYD